MKSLDDVFGSSTHWRSREPGNNSTNPPKNKAARFVHPRTPPTANCPMARRERWNAASRQASPWIAWLSSGSVHHTYTICTRYVHDAYTIRTRYAHDRYTISPGFRQAPRRLTPLGPHVWAAQPTRERELRLERPFQTQTGLMSALSSQRNGRYIADHIAAR
jgi:hypothetical protein